MDQSLRQFLLNIFPHVQINRTVTDDVFMFIESHPDFLLRYHQFCLEYGSHVVNPKIGRLVKIMNDLPNTGRTVAKSKLIRTYTLH